MSKSEEYVSFSQHNKPRVDSLVRVVFAKYEIPGSAREVRAMGPCYPVIPVIDNNARRVDVALPNL